MEESVINKYRLIGDENLLWRIKDDCQSILSLKSSNDFEVGMHNMAKRVMKIIGDWSLQEVVNGD